MVKPVVQIVWREKRESRGVGGGGQGGGRPLVMPGIVVVPVWKSSKLY